MSEVPFLDLKASFNLLQPEIESALLEVARSGWYIKGQSVTAFEQSFAEYTESNHCVGVASGLDALKLGLKALDIGPGDEVIVPAHTFIATWLAVSAVGATIVPVRPEDGGFNLAIDQIERLITPNTKAIIAVHLYGVPADVEKLVALSKKHNLALIEDAAQAHGAKYNGRRIGGHGDLVAWSFYPGKNLGALGDGGAVTTQDQALAEKISQLGNYGSSEKYFNDVLGFNSRLDEMQAAVLSVKLTHLDAWNQHRQHIAEQYNHAFKHLPVISSKVPAASEAVWHLYVLAVEDREALQAHLSKLGVQTLIHYPVAPHCQKAYQHAHFDPQDTDLAEQYASQVISLPIGPHLRDDQIKYVIGAVTDFYN